MDSLPDIEDTFVNYQFKLANKRNWSQNQFQKKDAMKRNSVQKMCKMDSVWDVDYALAFWTTMIMKWEAEKSSFWKWKLCLQGDIDPFFQHEFYEKPKLHIIILVEELILKVCLGINIEENKQANEENEVSKNFEHTEISGKDIKSRNNPSFKG